MRWREIVEDASSSTKAPRHWVESIEAGLEDIRLGRTVSGADVKGRLHAMLTKWKRNKEQEPKRGQILPDR